MPSADLLVWMDLEMTGLDPARERIIEMATLITDGELNLVAEGPELVVHQSDELLAAMDDWNQSHHGASGLIDRVRASTVTEADALAQTLDFLKEHCEPKTAPLCGNSIHQDRRFLRAYMTELDDFLHYRIVDVSSIKELARRWFPAIIEAAPPKTETHRALGDIQESIEELRYYRRAVFREA